MITRSDSIAKLAVALAKSQGEFRGAVKSSVNPHFKSRYADLEATWDACREPLSKNGLSVVQIPFDTDGRVGVETLLLHESGEWIGGRFSLKAKDETNPQNAGSILSYLRRYCLQGAVGLNTSDEDDDGASAASSPEGGKPQAVPLDPAIEKILEDAKTLEDLKKAWGMIPTGSRHPYTATKDRVKERIIREGT